MAPSATRHTTTPAKAHHIRCLLIACI
jgi:hypothetical protein